MNVGNNTTGSSRFAGAPGMVSRIGDYIYYRAGYLTFGGFLVKGYSNSGSAVAQIVILTNKQSSYDALSNLWKSLKNN